MNHFLPTFSQLVHSDDTLILAVSGGVDSMVLLDLTLQHHTHDRIIVAHFNHALRGDVSDEDAVFVRDFCQGKNIAFFSEKVDIAAMALDRKSSIEVTARAERYRFLEEIRAQNHAKYIVTAHHASDQTETILLNLIKGAKMNGLGGMSMVSGYIFRPLLDTKKSDILSYAREKNILFREDASNADTRYERNRMRHEVIPILKTINPELDRTCTQLAEYARDMQSWIENTIHSWLREQSEQKGEQRFSLTDFAALPHFLQNEIIAYLYRRANNGSAQGFSTGNLAEIRRFLLEPSNSHGIKIIKKLSLERRGDQVLIHHFPE